MMVALKLWILFNMAFVAVLLCRVKLKKLIESELKEQVIGE